MEGCDDVEEAGVGRSGEVVAGDVAEMEVTHDPEAVVDGDDHHVTSPGEVHAVVEHRGPAAGLEAAAVKPDEHRSLGVVSAGGPDVEDQAVLADLGPVVSEAALGQPTARLRRRLAVEDGIAHAHPRPGRLRGGRKRLAPSVGAP